MGRLTPIEAKALTVVETYTEGEDIKGEIDALALALHEQAGRRDSADLDHLDFVNVVLNECADDSLTAFRARNAADRFEAVLNHGCESDDEHPAAIYTLEVKAGPAAERLIASERAGVLESLGAKGWADRIQAGGSPAETLAALKARFNSTDEGVARLLQQWAEEDAREGDR